MPFASSGIRKIRRILPQIDFYDLIERRVPILDERLPDIEAGGIGCSACADAGAAPAPVIAPARQSPLQSAAMRLRPLISLSVPMDALQYAVLKRPCFCLSAMRDPRVCPSLQRD